MIDPAWMATLVRTDVRTDGHNELTSKAPHKLGIEEPCIFATDGYAALLCAQDHPCDVPQSGGLSTLRMFWEREPSGSATTVQVIKAWAASWVAPPKTTCATCNGTALILCPDCHGTGEIDRTTVECGDCGKTHECICDCENCDKKTHLAECQDCEKGVTSGPPLSKRMIRIKRNAITATVDAALIQKWTAGLPDGEIRVFVPSAYDAIEIYGDGWRLFIMPARDNDLFEEQRLTLELAVP